MLLESLRTLGFAAAVCAVCSIMVSTAAVTLRERQEQNQIVDRKKNVLAVAGLIEPGERLSGEEVNRRFDEGIQPRVVELRTLMREVGLEKEARALAVEAAIGAGI